MKDVTALMLDGSEIQRAQRRGLRKILERHKRLGNPIVVWRDGKVVWVPAEEIRIPEEPSEPASKP